MTDESNRPFDLADYPSLAAILAAPAPVRVSVDSVWSDDDWHLPGFTPGITEANFTLRFDVDGDRSVIDALKWLAALLFVGRYGQTTFKYSTAGAFSSGVRHMARFMKQRDYHSFANLDRSAYDEFVEDIHVKLVDPRDEVATRGETELADIAELVQEDGGEPMSRMYDDPEATGGTAKAYNRLRIWRLLWIHRDLMEKAGIKPLRYNPFTKETPTATAHRLATKAAKEIPALPDEVALPVLAGAVRMIGAPADDVVRLQALYLAQMARMDREPTSKERNRLRGVMQDYCFRTIKEEAKPWHDRIVLGDEEAGGGDTLAQLIGDVRDACLIVIMGFTGVRISEALSPEVEPRIISDDILPSCIKVETSKSGLSRHYMLHGLLSKAQERPTAEAWLMGARPVLAGTEPPSVRAVRVLELLYQPWRKMAADPLVRRQLFVGFNCHALPRRATTVTLVSSQSLRESMKKFVSNPSYVDLSGLAEAAQLKEELGPYVEENGACIQPHQWRKTFMRYAMRTDPRMAPAVSQHFKHYTVALTERDYGPKDIRFLEEADSTRARQTGAFLRRMVEGKTRPVARLDRAFELQKEQWRALVPDGEAHDNAAYTRVAIREDLRIWYVEHGRCLIALHPDEARCHERAGTAGWRHARPNSLTRTPALCSGCINFSVHGGSAAFWRKRYVDNQTAYLRSGGELGFEIIRRRAEQARNYLRALGEEMPDIGDGDGDGEEGEA